MKNVLKIVFGMIFVLGMISMSNISATTKKSDTVMKVKVPCVYVYDVCDALYPDDYGSFDDCMTKNDC